VREEAAYPDISGAAAIDGTGSHLLLELCAGSVMNAEDYIGELIGIGHEDMPQGWLVDEARAARVQMCLDYIDARRIALREKYENSHISVQAESKSYPDRLIGRDDWHGTCDVAILVTDRLTGQRMHVEVMDYKDGRGYVSEKNNTQLQAYLLGKRDGIQGSTLQMAIVQPKTDRPIKVEVTTDKELDERLVFFKERAEATDDPDAPLIAGKHCQWCKHKPNCKAEVQKSVAVANTDMLELMTHSVETLTDEQLVQLFDAEAGMMSAFDRVREELEKRDNVNGVAMLPGRATKVWNESEEEVVKQLKKMKLKVADIYPKKLISPAQALKKVKDKDAVKELISEKAGKDKLTRVKNKPTAQEMFKVSFL